MRIGYIVVAHALPAQLVRLVRRLDDGRARFFVHYDRRAPRAEFELLERELGPLATVELLPRHRCHWGSWSLVEAALKGIRALLADPSGLDYGVLLTGQDYPLRAAAAIARELERAEGRSFMTHRPASGRFLRRLDRYHWHGTVLGRRLRLPNRLLPVSVKRTIPAGLVPTTGSAHWCLSRACLEHVATREPEVVEFFRWSAVPDEQFFQTILMSSPLAGSIVDDDRRFMIWPPEENSPRVLTLADLDAMLASTALFARKFDERIDAAVLDALDERIGTHAIPA